jgi:transcriptional regulator with XRE-family HTH domain
MRNKLRNKHPDYSFILNAHIGGQLKKRRKELGLRQQEVAVKLGVSYQQLQKFESGKNRVSPTELVLLSKILKSKLMYFFEDMPEPPDMT